MPQHMVAGVTGSSAGMSPGISTCVFLYMEITRQSDFLHVLSTEQGNQVEVTQPNSGCQVASCLPRFVGFSKVIWPGKQDSRILVRPQCVSGFIWLCFGRKTFHSSNSFNITPCRVSLIPLDLFH